MEDWTTIEKQGFLIALDMTIKKDPTMTMNKHANENCEGGN